jgi:hypothetical protein
MAEPYIRTSRAFGLSRRLVTYKYALKNACIPTITILGMGVGRLLGGAVLVEIVFARPGLGRLIYQAISERNYPVVQGAVLSRAAVDRQIELYRAYDVEARRQIVGLQPKRADVILAGACVVRTVMDKLGRDALSVSDRGLRHGVLLERFG